MVHFSLGRSRALCRLCLIFERARGGEPGEGRGEGREEGIFSAARCNLPNIGEFVDSYKFITYHCSGTRYFGRNITKDLISRSSCS